MKEDAPATEGRLATADGSAAASRPRHTLLVMSQSGVFTYALPVAGPITIGRGTECEIRIDDGKASRRHAVVHVGESCTIEDLASLNGTRVGDRTLPPRTPTELRPGEMASIGSTVLVLQVTAEHAPPTRVWSLGAFEERLGEERARASARGGSFGLLLLELPSVATIGAASTSTSRAPSDVARVEALEQTFRECLRPGDVVGSTAPGLYEVLLTGTTADEAVGIGTVLRSHLLERGIHHVLKLAVFPRDGATRELLAQNAFDLDDEEEPPASRAAGSAMEDRLSPMVRKIAVGEINVLILGETGVGKEVLARTIHMQSPRRASPLVCINCAALSESLLESELFGHEKGAFTGATHTKAGLLESADGGTVFLDELGEMPLTLQAKLLRVLEQREVLRVGSLRPRAIDVRFLAATNRDVTAEVAVGRLRQDLYYRLNGVTIVVPPLRERLDEITPLAREFAKQAAERSRRGRIPQIAPQVLDLLQRYPWPGNVRELRNMMERAVLLTTGDLITLESFPSEMMAGPVVAIRVSFPADRTLPGAIAAATIPPPAPPSATSEGDDRDERTRIVQALEACQGNQTQAAKMLGISRRTLVTRLGEYALPRPRKR